MEFTIQKIAENIWAIEQKGVRAFLLVGRSSAILVDTCFGGDIRSVCQSITNNPITLITTHSDGDHIGCDQQFSVQYLQALNLKDTKAGAKEHLMRLQCRRVMYSRLANISWRLF